MRGQCSVYPFRFSYCSALLLSSQSRSTRALRLLFIVVKSYGGRIAISIGVRSGIYEGQGDASAEPISIGTEKIERLSPHHDEFCRTQRYWTAVVPPNGYTAGRFHAPILLTYTLSSYFNVRISSEYLITLNSEIKYYWPPQNRFTLVSFFFFLNRYLPLFGHVPFIVATMLTVEQATICPKLTVYHEYFALVMEINIGWLLMIRTYALYDKSKVVLGSLYLLGSAGIIFTLWALITQKDAYVLDDASARLFALGVVGCSSALGDDLSKRLGVTWAGVLIFDIAVFGLTAYKAFKLRRSGRLLQILLRDGSMYFLTIFCANAVNIGILLTAKPLVRGLMVPFINIISTCLASRLMLNIRSSHSKLSYSSVAHCDNQPTHNYNNHTTGYSGNYDVRTTSSRSSGLHLTTIIDDVGGADADMSVSVYDAGAGGTSQSGSAPRFSPDEMRGTEERGTRALRKVHDEPEWLGLEMVRNLSRERCNDRADD